jgi:hypothetical protein
MCLHLKCYRIVFFEFVVFRSEISEQNVGLYMNHPEGVATKKVSSICRKLSSSNNLL